MAQSTVGVQDILGGWPSEVTYLSIYLGSEFFPYVRTQNLRDLYIRQPLSDYRRTVDFQGLFHIDFSRNGPIQPGRVFSLTEYQPKLSALVLSFFVDECETESLRMQKNLNRPSKCGLLCCIIWFAISTAITTLGFCSCFRYIHDFGKLIYTIFIQNAEHTGIIGALGRNRYSFKSFLPLFNKDLIELGFLIIYSSKFRITTQIPRLLV